MKSIAGIDNCFGCGVCALVCPKNIIALKINSDGFFHPHIIREDNCTNCGLCRQVCAYINESEKDTENNVKCFASWSKDETIREQASSGGVGFEIASHLINSGFKACVVRYNGQLERVEHYIASDVDMLKESFGSKYLQSYTVDGFNSIDPSQKYLITGTPCQIASFRRYVELRRKQDNFILLDFFCHGVPSKLLWSKYIAEVEKTTGHVNSVSWRTKEDGWYASYKITIEGENDKYISQRFQDDLFFMGFIGDSCLNQACYDSCKYKYDSSSADIRIGDMWGSIYKDNKLGVSAVVAFTEKGENALKLCNCEFISHSFGEVAEGQQKSRAKRSAIYPAIMVMLRDKTTTSSDIYRVFLKNKRRRILISQITHPTRTYKNIVKRIFKTSK